ncbi:ABC transporter ATP-binding protein [Synechococcus sp. R3-13]|jgi:putative spermidine/putrescine transport system ATP-binding protein|uniref:ABC transporter ATP-binding protein n=1 Tax=Synechococcus sp. R3-13 TaxID=2421316 RepID=UPI0039C0C12C
MIAESVLASDVSSAKSQAGREEGSPPAIRLRRVSRNFSGIQAVDGVDLEVQQGEFFTLLGPSGSGKTTCLRMIAGFERPDEGQIELNGQNVLGLPPYRRPVNTVFQDYALFPHMTVAENVGYSLMIRGIPPKERQKRVQEALELVQLPDLGSRKPSQLSGGQRQRVALARALVGRPQVLLLDEPLGALDLKLRQQMQFELKALQHRLGLTFLYVTHDQEEALTMSDRIAVFNRGRIEQVGSPAELYERPATRFVAGFIGQTNLIEGSLAERCVGEAALFALRPEHIRIDLSEEGIPDGHCRLRGRICDTAYLGAFIRYQVWVSGCEVKLLAVQPNPGLNLQQLPEGTEVTLSWDPSRMHRIPE